MLINFNPVFISKWHVLFEFEQDHTVWLTSILISHTAVKQAQTHTQSYPKKVPKPTVTLPLNFTFFFFFFCVPLLHA